RKPSEDRTRKHMLLERISEWARSYPNKTAVVYGDVAIDYASVVRGIDAARSFLEKRELPPGRTGIVLIKHPMDAWIVLFALRSLGLNTISIESFKWAEELKLRDIACVITTQADVTSRNIETSQFPGVPVILIPPAIFNNVLEGEIPTTQSN